MESIPKKSGIYQIRNLVNGKIYVGSSVNLETRKTRHYWELENNRHNNQHLQRAYNKYGLDKLVFEVLEYVEKDMLLEREQYYINILDAVSSGYNICPIAGSSRGRILSEQHKSNISKSKIGHSVSKETRMKLSAINQGKNNPNYGMHRSEYTKKKSQQSQPNKQTVYCIETNQKFNSLCEASRWVKGDKRGAGAISQCCKGNQKTAYGYHWEYTICSGGL